MAVCSEIHTKHINTLCGQNVELLNVKLAGTYSDHCAVEGKSKRQFVQSAAASLYCPCRPRDRCQLSRMLTVLKNLPVPPLFTKFPHLIGPEKFNTLFTKAL